MQRNPITHTLKIVKPHFEYVREGKKNFEVRFDDRDYKLGDILILQEYHYNGSSRLEATGKQVERKIKHILRKFKGLQTGYVVLGLDN